MSTVSGFYYSGHCILLCYCSLFRPEYCEYCLDEYFIWVPITLAAVFSLFPPGPLGEYCLDEYYIWVPITLADVFSLFPTGLLDVYRLNEYCIWVPITLAAVFSLFPPGL